MHQHSKDRPRRPAGAGRKAGGPNGEPRDLPIGFRVAATERDAIHELLRRRGHPPDATGARALLLELAAAEQQAA